MAFDSDDKTEPPTPKRRTDARKKGEVAQSHDLSAAMPLLMGFLALYWLGPGLWHALLAIMTGGLSPENPTSGSDIYSFSEAVMLETLRHLGPYLLILLLAVLVTMVSQVGWLVTFQPIIPRLSKINPLNGIKRIFSIRSIMLSVINMGKLIVVVGVVYFTMRGDAAAILYAASLNFYDVFNLGVALTFKLGMRMAAALVILALLDYAWQRYRHEKDLRMTKEEVKDEMRSMDGDPKLKERRRQAQLQLSLQRMRKDVPQADVIVTNPTHLAVAIQYDVQSMDAPKVIAKGADYLALRIRQVATEFGIPIVERKPLARALYETVEVGQYVPEKFYRAIAEILAYVYELTNRQPRGLKSAVAAAG